MSGRPIAVAAAAASYLALLLWADRFAGASGQLALGALTWVALILACRPLRGSRRAQVAIVVLAATCGEVTGSLILGVYTYRLENLPSFVPPAHGLVYVAGLALARAAAARPQLLVRAALAGVLAWGIAGVTVLPRTDAGGFAGAMLLAVFLVRGRAPAVYAGVFLVVGALELYGTALGTWTWHETIPGTGVPNGNPPSGVASGYVFFDVVALALAPWMLRAAQRLKRQRNVRSVPARAAPAEA